MSILSLMVLLFSQVPAARTVIVGLADGQQILLENPQFSGFINGGTGAAVLMYRQENFHGEMLLAAVSRIEFREYERGKPFAMTVTLKGGRKLDVESARRNFLRLRGLTEFGSVTINHPDPRSTPVRLTTKKPDRKNDLTIQYLEFPAS